MKQKNTDPIPEMKKRLDFLKVSRVFEKTEKYDLEIKKLQEKLDSIFYGFKA